MMKTMPVPMTRYGCRVDLTGAQVVCQYGTRTLLGDVAKAYYKDFPPYGYRLKVKHFNGEPWPFDPSPLDVRLLVRCPVQAKEEG